ncbi:hypothetical protein KY290_010053 [Solanum tuberosum]|uniref:Uncharacterized protein n=1 Tax=Solanum tuberosum TaxID=4113 RepID=A0ABQ7VWN4_SOLTU|nr:hypothetical protein KY289_010434 [Solanum tuberosum]KAH0708580.1 hypothetical protein KY284_010007 [Solanum tuberosum]KAH0772916.1 hypothetical protein KY290_010053 [Solanum tuberosum]
MQTKIQQLKKEEAEVEAKVNMYLQKLKHFESTVLLYEKEAARNRVVHVLLIQKRLQHLEAKDDDIVEVNTKPSTAMHIFNKSNCHQLHLHQFIQLQMQMEMPVVNEEMKAKSCFTLDQKLTLKYISRTGNVVDTDMVIAYSRCGSSNTDLICAKMNMLNSPDVRTLHHMPITGDSMQLEDKNTTHTQQPAGSAAASALPPAYRDCFNCPRKLYIEATQSTTFTDIPHEIIVVLLPLLSPVPRLTMRLSSIQTYLLPPLQLPPVICFFLCICEYAKLL